MKKMNRKMEMKRMRMKKMQKMMKKRKILKVFLFDLVSLMLWPPP